MEKLRLFNFGPKLYNKLLITYPQLSTLMFNQEVDEDKSNNFNLKKMMSNQGRPFRINNIEVNLQNIQGMQGINNLQGMNNIHNMQNSLGYHNFQNMQDFQDPNLQMMLISRYNDDSQQSQNYGNFHNFQD